MAHAETPMNEKTEYVRDRIADHLDEIKTLFKPGVLVTILVRTPAYPDGIRDLVMTDDTLDAAINALQQRKKEWPTS